MDARDEDCVPAVLFSKHAITNRTAAGEPIVVRPRICSNALCPHKGRLLPEGLEWGLLRCTVDRASVAKFCGLDYVYELLHHRGRGGGSFDSFAEFTEAHEASFREHGPRTAATEGPPPSIVRQDLDAAYRVALCALCANDVAASMRCSACGDHPDSITLDGVCAGPMADRFDLLAPVGGGDSAIILRHRMGTTGPFLDTRPRRELLAAFLRVAAQRAMSAEALAMHVDQRLLASTKLRPIHKDVLGPLLKQVVALRGQYDAAAPGNERVRDQLAQREHALCSLLHTVGAVTLPPWIFNGATLGFTVLSQLSDGAVLNEALRAAVARVSPTLARVLQGEAVCPEYLREPLRILAQQHVKPFMDTAAAVAPDALPDGSAAGSVPIVFAEALRDLQGGVLRGVYGETTKRQFHYTGEATGVQDKDASECTHQLKGSSSGATSSIFHATCVHGVIVYLFMLPGAECFAPVIDMLRRILHARRAAGKHAPLTVVYDFCCKLYASIASKQPSMAAGIVCVVSAPAAVRGSVVAGCVCEVAAACAFPSRCLAPNLQPHVAHLLTPVRAASRPPNRPGHAAAPALHSRSPPSHRRHVAGRALTPSTAATTSAAARTWARPASRGSRAPRTRPAPSRPTPS